MGLVGGWAVGSKDIFRPVMMARKQKEDVSVCVCVWQSLSGCDTQACAAHQFQAGQMSNRCPECWKSRLQCHFQIKPPPHHLLLLLPLKQHKSCQNAELYVSNNLSKVNHHPVFKSSRRIVLCQTADFQNFLGTVKWASEWRGIQRGRLVALKESPAAAKGPHSKKKKRTSCGHWSDIYL